MQIENVHLRNTSASADFNKSGISQRRRKKVFSHEMRSLRQETEVVATHKADVYPRGGGTGVSKVINVMLHTMGGLENTTRQTEHLTSEEQSKTSVAQ